MARRRILEYGPSVRTPRTTMQPVSTHPENAREGVFFRVPPGTVLGVTATVKSRMGARPHRGIKAPGYQAPDLIGPTS